MGEASGEYKLKHAILELKRENKQLASDLIGAREEVAHNKEKVKKLQLKLHSISKDGSDFFDENGGDLLVISKKKYDQKENEIKEFKKMWMTTKSELDNAREVIQEHEANISYLEKSIEEKDGEIRSITTDVEDLSESEKQLKTMLNEERERYVHNETKSAATIKEHLTNIKDKEEDIENMTVEHAQNIEETVGMYQSRISEITSKCDEMAKQLLTSRTETENLKGICKENQTEIAKKTKEIEETIMKITKLQKTLKETDEKLREQIKENEDYKQQYMDLDERFTDKVITYENVCKQLRDEVDIKVDEIQNLREKMDQMTVKMIRNEVKPRWK